MRVARKSTARRRSNRAKRATRRTFMRTRAAIECSLPRDASASVETNTGRSFALRNARRASGGS
eukprot:10211257-Lingulodinium_polyedra.AAC.1